MKNKKINTNEIDIDNMNSEQRQTQMVKVLNQLNQGDFTGLYHILEKHKSYFPNDTVKGVTLVEIVLFEATRQNQIEVVDIILSHPVLKDILARPELNSEVIWVSAVAKNSVASLSLLYNSEFRQTFEKNIPACLSMAYGNGYGAWDSFEYLLKHTEAISHPDLIEIEKDYDKRHSEHAKNDYAMEYAMAFYPKFKILVEQHKLRQLTPNNVPDTNVDNWTPPKVMKI